MKPWQTLLTGVFFGILAGAFVMLINLRPMGEAIQLPALPTPAPLVVHITGAVLQEGIYPLPAASRLEDAVQAAGGLLESADASQINLAARLTDGQKIVIPEIRSTTEAGSLPPATRSAAQIDTAPENHLININTATLEELDSLPGIGEGKAAEIIKYRESNGPFDAIEDIQNVPGIGPKIFETIQPLITIF